MDPIRRRARPPASPLATDARPTPPGVNSPSIHCGSRRVTHVVVVTCDISSSSWIAEMPPPATTTCWAAHSAALTERVACEKPPPSHDDVLAGELRGAHVLRDVQLAALEGLHARVPGPVRRGPRAG